MRHNSFSHTLQGGLLAITITTGMLVVSKALGVFQLNLGRLLGTFLTTKRRPSEILGWALHFVSGTLFALLYRTLFRRTSLQPTPIDGAKAGLGHALLALPAIILLPRLHPRPREAGLRRFTPFAYGTLPGWLFGHAIYGVLVGWFLHSPSRLNGAESRATQDRRPGWTHSESC